MTQLTKDKKELLYSLAEESDLLIVNERTGSPADLRLKSRLEKFAILIIQNKDNFNSDPEPT